MFDRMRRRRQRERAKAIGGGHMNRLIPNAITVGALCAGLSGIRFAIDARWEMAVGAIIVAAILDGLDGRMARLLNGTSKFGAELDSLSDFVSFGAAPALIVYLWTLNAWGSVGWVIALGFAVCCALRLARFNTALSDPNPPRWSSHFFMGVPAPAGASLALLPMILTFEAGSGWGDRPIVGAVVLAGVATLMVSRIPTFSGKKLHIPRGWMVPTLAAVGVFFAMLASAPWATLLVLGIAYMLAIPVSFVVQRRMRAAETAAPAEAGAQPSGKPILCVVGERGAADGA